MLHRVLPRPGQALRRKGGFPSDMGRPISHLRFQHGRIHPPQIRRPSGTIFDIGVVSDGRQRGGAARREGGS